LNLEIFNNLINNVKESNFVQNFISELTNFLENNSKLNEINQLNKYSDYWKYQNFIEDNVAASIGISRWSTDVRYSDELKNAVDDSILELADQEGTLYRKQFTPNGPTYNQTYNVDKFEDGKIEHLTLSGDKLPKGFNNEDIIFEYKEDGSIKVRNDLKYKVIKLASESVKYLKEEENEKALDYKKEGHIYKALENDGYVFLKDLTEERDYVLEDIDFVVDSYKGEGKYQVISGEYKKLEE